MHAGDWKSEEALDPLELELRVDVGAGTLQYTCIEVRRTYSHQFLHTAFYPVPRSQAQDDRLGSKCAYLLSHLPILRQIFLIIGKELEVECGSKCLYPSTRVA